MRLVSEAPLIDTTTLRVNEKPAAVTRYVYVPGETFANVTLPSASVVPCATAAGVVTPLFGFVDGALMSAKTLTLAPATGESSSALTTEALMLPPDPLDDAIGSSPR